MDRNMLNACLESDLLLRDGMRLMEAEVKVKIEDTRGDPLRRNTKKKTAQKRQFDEFSEYYLSDPPASTRTTFRGGEAPPEHQKISQKLNKLKAKPNETIESKQRRERIKSKLKGIADTAQVEKASGRVDVRGGEPIAKPKTVELGHQQETKGKAPEPNKEEPGMFDRLKRWFYGDEKPVNKRIKQAADELGHGVRHGSLMGHAATFGAGALTGGHLTKKHMIDKAWKYGVPAAAGVGALGHLAGRSSRDDR